MIDFYTSYYANYENIPKNYICVPISRVVPDGFSDYPNITIIKDNFIAPDDNLLFDYKNGRIDEIEYKKRYINKICTYINSCDRFNDLFDWAKAVDKHYGDEYDGIVFLCYEKPGDFCHRHIFSKLLNLYGIECKEFKIDNKNDALF